MTEARILHVTRKCVSDLMYWGVPYDQAVAEFRREYIHQLLLGVKGNQCKAAEILGVHRNSIKRFIDELGVEGCRPYRRSAALTEEVKESQVA